MLAVVFVFASLCFNMAAPKPKRARKDKKELEEDLGVLADVLDMKGTKAEETHGEQKVLAMPGPEHVLKHLRDHFVTCLQIIFNLKFVFVQLFMARSVLSAQRFVIRELVCVGFVNGAISKTAACHMIVLCSTDWVA